ncbi:MAG: ankyrin repeat domain-containing protein [Bacteroidia bacterium]
MEKLFQELLDAISVFDKAEVLTCIEKGVDVNYMPNGASAISLMALISNIGYSYNDIETPEEAAEYQAEDMKKMEIIKMLISHGADINLYDKEDGFTALEIASSKARVELVHFLLENGADPNINLYDTEDPEYDRIISSCLHTAKRDYQLNLYQNVTEKYGMVIQLLEMYGAIEYKGDVPRTFHGKQMPDGTWKRLS